VQQSFPPAGSGSSKTAIFQRGLEHHQAGRFLQAEAAYRQALALDPNDADTLHLLGVLGHQFHHHEPALHYINQAIRLEPDRAHYHSNAALALRALGRMTEAEETCRTALRLNPDYPEAQNNLGMILRALGQIEGAEFHYREAVRLKPDYPDALNNLAHLCLLTGRLEEGWRLYDWRVQSLGVGRRDFAQPLWDGAPLGDRVLLLHAEQGLGDTLQFCRYVPILARGAKLVFEVQPPLVRLLSDLPGMTRIVAAGDALPHFDVHCPLLSVPHRVGTDLATIPAEIPYLAADPARSASWRGRLAGLDGKLVGLVWAGRSRPATAVIDRSRSMALEQFSPLAGIDGVNFLSLQKGEPAAQALSPPGGMVLHDFTEELTDFADTAALIDALDLVISVDTSVVHLAGALGKPVWLLNRFDTCWRWLEGRDDSPWYPTLRQFRQKSPGDWAGVMAEVRDALVGIGRWGVEQGENRGQGK
jgi:Tetratricopeptide repeat/TPR repeat/Glycosyltransferase family 9 (heptosyltransferase)